MKLSVILCTHNPNPEYLRRTLDSLRAQTLPHGDWEFILVDNASGEPLKGRVDLAWHPSARLVEEPTLGLTAARMRGIRESTGDIICFADDDNILAPDYLEQAIIVAREKTWIGCWGGEIHGEFEQEPPLWFAKYRELLVVRPLARDTWGNAYRYDDASPCGAGMCVRRNVVEKFIANCRMSPLRLKLGRKGKALASGEDTDLAYTAIDLGMGTGRFKSMQMRHLIPSGRVKLDYLLRLHEAVSETNLYVLALRPDTRSQIPAELPLKARIYSYFYWLKLPKVDKLMNSARYKGIRRALKLFAREGG